MYFKNEAFLKLWVAVLFEFWWQIENWKSGCPKMLSDNFIRNCRMFTPCSMLFSALVFGKAEDNISHLQKYNLV